MAKKCNEFNCNSPVFSNHYCRAHQYMRDDDKWINKKSIIKQVKPIKKISSVRALRNDKLKILYDSILSTRKHVSFVSGLKIEGTYVNCAHVLPKGIYKEYALCDFNIVLLTAEEHHLFDHGTKEQRIKYAIEHNCYWIILYQLVDELKQRYKKEHETNTI